MKNREQRRKNKMYQDVTRVSDENYELRNLVIIIIVIVLVFALIYLISNVFIKNDSNSFKDEVPTATIQYENILYTGVFNRSEKEYYVMLYDFKLENVATLNYLYTNYKKKDTKIATYVVNLKDRFNSNILVTDNGNHKATKPSELKVKTPTLIKIKDGKIDKYIEGIDAISKELK